MTRSSGMWKAEWQGVRYGGNTDTSRTWLERKGVLSQHTHSPQNCLRGLRKAASIPRESQEDNDVVQQGFWSVSRAMGSV